MDEDVYFLDFHPPFPGQGYEELLKITPNIYWFDHHASNFKYFSDKKYYDILGSRSDTFPSACELVWEYFHEKLIEYDKGYYQLDTPEFVKKISDHDSWRHKIPGSDAFCLGMDLIEDISDPKGVSWETFFLHWELPLIGGKNHLIKEMNQIQNNGYIVSEYLEKSNARYVDAFSYEIEWEGYRCIVCNRGMTGSYLFKSIWDPKKYDLMLAYVNTGNKYIVSIYTETEKTGIKANDIAVKNGGGGHPGAAGFTCHILPFGKGEIDD